MNLRFRLNCIFFMMVALMIISGTILVVFNARQSVQSEIQSAIHLAVELIRSELADKRVEGRFSRDWVQHLNNLRRARHLKIDIQSLPVGNKENTETILASSPSVANVPEWFVWSVTPEALTFNQSFGFLDENDRQIVIEADPGDEIAEAWNEALDLFVLIAGTAVVVSVLFTITVQRALNPVSVILGALDRLENGQYDAPLPEFSLPEFTRIAHAINHTGAALEKAEKENRSLRQHSLEVREQERQFLARELHDEFGQSLSAIKAIVSSLKSQADSSSRVALESVNATCDHLFSVLSNMLRRLHPLILDELGLKATLEDMLETWSIQQPLQTLDHRCDPAIDQFPRNFQIHVYRIIQECLTNIVKHANARHVSVNVRVDSSNDESFDAMLCVEVCDDGQGFDPQTVQSGFGLRGIRERVEALGGKMAIRAACGQGMRVQVEIPFKRRGV